MAQAQAQVDADHAVLLAFLGAEERAGRSVPTTAQQLYGRWAEVLPDSAAPFDPFYGGPYTITVRAGTLVLTSPGPDGRPLTKDDLTRSGRWRAVRSSAPVT